MIQGTMNVTQVNDDSVKKVKVVEVKECPASGGNKVFVTLELPLEGAGQTILDVEQFFHQDAVKRLAIKEAAKEFNRQAGWSDVSRLRYVKDGELVTDGNEANGVQITYTCLASL